MPDLTGRQLGPYRLIAPLGAGGMASVYKALQPTVNRYVAIKVLPRHLTEDPHFAARFRREAKVLAQLQHPHILPIFDFGESDGVAFLVMPLIHGGTLADRLKAGGPLDDAAVDRLFRQLGDALDYAHSKGVTHRDIKPANILLDESGNCLLADFGISQLAQATTRVTISGTVLGTPEYMSPEQASGEGADHRSDLYSAGIVLFECVTGTVPFTGDTPLSVALKHLHEPLPRPRSLNEAISPQLEAVIFKALALVRDDRFQSGADLAAAVSRALGGGRPAVPASPAAAAPAPAAPPPAAPAETRTIEIPRGPAAAWTPREGDLAGDPDGYTVVHVPGDEPISDPPPHPRGAVVVGHSWRWRGLAHAAGYSGLALGLLLALRLVTGSKSTTDIDPPASLSARPATADMPGAARAADAPAPAAAASERPVVHADPPARLPMPPAPATTSIPPPPPPPPPPPAPQPVRVGGNIKPPTKTRDVRPAYPIAAQVARVQGVVIVEATIAPDGHVSQAKVLRSIPLLDQAALDAVRQWEFTPTLLNGVATPVIMTVTVNFTLD